ncbi:MAG TPA: ATP-binding protein [Holophagaceae bacterium]|nr:ATP-binding protein [Holophagaceae bacterium]
MSIQEIIDQLNQLDESENIEAKHGRSAGKSIAETISAFSNEPNAGGGTIVLGLTKNPDPSGPKYLMEGVSDPDRVQADLASLCASNFNTVIRPSISVEDINGKNIISVNIPEASPSEKPVFIKATGLPKGAFRRIGTTDQRCTDEDIAVLFENRGFESFDQTLVNGACISDLDVSILDEYRKIRKSYGDQGDDLDWNDEELFQALGCLKLDDSGKFVPTVAGIILFGTKIALRRFFPMTRLEFIRVPGREWVQDPDERFEQVDLREPLFSLIRKAQVLVQESLPKKFSILEGELQRTETPVIPQRVLREAIVNALMHRSYKQPGAVQIIRFSDRIEILNPGHSIKSIEKLDEPGSLSRNPHIAAVLYEAGFAETKGSGIRAIKRIMGTEGLAPPIFKSIRDDNRFFSCFWLHQFLTEQESDWLSNFKDLISSDDEARVMIYIREIGRIDNSTYRELTLVDTLTASNRLRKLREAGLIEARDRGASTFYVPTSLLLDPLNNPIEIQSEDSQKTYQPMLFDLYETKPLIVERANEPIQNSWAYAQIGITEAASLKVQEANLNRKTPNVRINKLILDMCAIQPITSDQLGLIFRKEKVEIVREHLKPLTEKGLLEFVNIGSALNPIQAYTISRKGE